MRAIRAFCKSKQLLHQTPQPPCRADRAGRAGAGAEGSRAAPSSAAETWHLLGIEAKVQLGWSLCQKQDKPPGSSILPGGPLGGADRLEASRGRDAPCPTGQLTGALRCRHAWAPRRRSARRSAPLREPQPQGRSAPGNRRCPGARLPPRPRFPRRSPGPGGRYLPPPAADRRS